MKSDGVYGDLNCWRDNNHVFFLSLLKVNSCFPLCAPGIFPHDPVSFVALVQPDLFTYKTGVVRVETQGICTGHTLMDQGLKKYVHS